MMGLDPVSDRRTEPTFGYHPDADRVDVPLDLAEFSRAVVLDRPVANLRDRVADCRILWQAEAGLPEGVYWFEGIESPMLMQVAAGAPPGDSAVVPVASLPDDHPLMNAWGWAEELWERAVPVPAPKFAINEVAVTHPGDRDVTIRDRRFFSDEWSYSVTMDGRRIDVIESKLRARPQLDDPRAWVLKEPTPAGRFGATLTRAKLLGKFANTLFSFRATRTTFRPYQFKPVLKLLQTGKARLLIADEVGLGKTIEAGLIWTELEARQEADRVLVVCPSSLLAKWKEEMADRFGFELTELDASGLAQFYDRHLQNRLPRRQAYICSMERLRTWGGLDDFRDVPPEFDLVIVDEAHSMRNSDTKSYALGTQLDEWADNLVFLTATPINLHQTDLLNLLELLAPGDYGDIRDLEMRLEPNRITNRVVARLSEKGVTGHELLGELEQLSATPYGRALTQRPDFNLLRDVLGKTELTPRDIVDAKRTLSELNTLSTVITRTKKVEVDDRKAKRKEDRRNIQWTDAEERFYAEYLEWCRTRAAELGRPLYFAMQMPLRLASACLPMARKAVLEPDAFGQISDSDSGEVSSRLEPHEALVDAALALPEGVDTKFDVLREVLSSLHSGNRQALIFTFSVPTLAYLSDRLSEDYRVAVMHGGVKRESRIKIMADFRSGQYDFVLANRVASEGLDFEFCSAVVNYDLPWNPMEIEQRIGRIDRIGQQDEAIVVVNFVNESTIDERILSRLLDRIEIFESSIGALEPIVTVHAREILQAGFDFTLTRCEREQKVHEMLTALEEQRAGLEDVADAASALLVSNDVEVAGLEDDLVRTGQYIGQQELASLLDDWARIDGAPGIKRIGDGNTVELLGNPAMASRVNDLVKKHQRTRSETRLISASLRNELPIPLVLDQETARTGGGTLLTATNPLVMAAASVPGHRQARFASLRIVTGEDDVVPGIYIVVLATAISAARGGDEIWGSAVDQQGRNAGEWPVNVLLAALAEGNLADAPMPDVNKLDRLAERALNQLHFRHAREQKRRDDEFESLRDAKLISLRAQHLRRREAIENRIATAQSRGRGERAIDLFRSQLRRAEERYEALVADLSTQAQPEIRLEPLGACVMNVGVAGESA